MNKLTIIQPGRIGDILLTLPIALYYYSRGYSIIWPISKDYIWFKEYIKFLEVVEVGTMEPPYKKLVTDSKKYSEGKVLDLSIGFGDGKLDTEWKSSNLSFDEWKYKKAEVPFEQRYNLPLCLSRNHKKEKDLLLGVVSRKINLTEEIKNKKPTRRFITVHSSGTNRRFFDFNIEEIHTKIRPINGYSVIDWLSVLKNSQEIFTVDSCIGILVELFQMKPKYGRHFHKWTEYYNDQQLRLLTPKISNDWQIV
jgi:hypothetical protein